jgi:hypothetical protein
MAVTSSGAACDEEGAFCIRAVRRLAASEGQRMNLLKETVYVKYKVRYGPQNKCLRVNAGTV